MENNSTTALAPLTGPVTVLPAAPAVPQMNLGEVERLAGILVKSGICGVKSPETAVVMMLTCQAEGLHPIEVARRYHFIEGRPSLRADAIQAEFQRRGGTVRWQECSDTRVVATFSHPAGGEITVTWDMDRARNASLTNKSTWKSYPQQMLRARCISEGVRAILPGVCVGIYTPEEQEVINEEERERQRHQSQRPVVTAPRQSAASAPPPAQAREAEAPAPAPAPAPNNGDSDRQRLIQAFIDAAGAKGLDLSDRKVRRIAYVALMHPTGPVPDRVPTHEEWAMAAARMNGLTDAEAAALLIEDPFAEDTPPSRPAPSAAAAAAQEALL